MYNLNICLVDIPLKMSEQCRQNGRKTLRELSGVVLVVKGRF